MEQWRKNLHRIVYRPDTPEGMIFDSFCYWAIFLSVVTVVVESISAADAVYGSMLIKLEWVFTILFTVEYILRFISVEKPMLYATSFFGIIDFIAIAPTYLSVFYFGFHAFIILRLLRLIRVFRLLKMVRHVSAAHSLVRAIRSSWEKIVVFMLVVLSIIVIIGSCMYLIEGPENGFSSIPKSMYWAIVTMSTVGFGDLVPNTIPGQIFTSFMILLGYIVVAVPTGIISAEMIRSNYNSVIKGCISCGCEQNEYDSKFCKRCGSRLK
jgi:voltage-gated potassium channel